MGYFRILYYISYIFNTICRILKRNKKIILILLLIVLLFLFSNKSFGAYEGNTTYTDPNQLLFSTYHSFCLDFLRRYDVAESYTGTTNKEDINDLIHNKLYNYYIFYGAGSEYYEAPATNGGSMLNQTTYQNRSMYIIFMDNSVNSFERTLTSNTYFGINNVAVDKFKFTDLSKVIIYRIANNTITKLRYLNSTSYVEIFIPGPLWFYNDNYIFDYFYNNMSLSDIELLYDINEGVNNIQDTLTDDTVSSDTTDTTDEIIQDSIDIFDNSYTNSYNTYNNSFLNSILTPIQQMVDGTTTKSVTFTLPFVDYSFTIRSNAIYSHISTTALYTLIQLFWWVTFSIPIYKLLRRIIIWLGTGEFINKPSKFAMYMSDFISQNITPGMM